MKKDMNALNIGIINGAQTGYCVKQERLFGVSLIEQLTPDIVILGIFAENDIMGDYFEEYLDYDVKYGYRLRKDRCLKIMAFDFLRTHSYLWMLIEGRWNALKRKKKYKQFKAVKKTSIQKVIQPTLNTIKKFRDYCDINDIIFGVMMIPPKSGGTIFDEPLRTFLQKERIALLDLGSKGYGDQEYITGDGHWNKKGHEKTSQFLVSFVMGLLEKKED
jgi:hypothetical protein